MPGVAAAAVCSNFSMIRDTDSFDGFRLCPPPERFLLCPPAELFIDPGVLPGEFPLALTLGLFPQPLYWLRLN